jgi:putative transposase
VHITLRLCSDIPRLRNRALCKIIRAALIGVMGIRGFRICHFSIQRDHIHLICEAEDNRTLARGMQSFKSRLTRNLNRHLERSSPRTGTAFADRYHMRVATTPRQVRHALCYVLHNAKRHNLPLPAELAGIDPYSSAWWFDGWANNTWRAGLPPPKVRTTQPAESWLLARGWRRYGLIDPGEAPSHARCTQ